MPQGSILGPLLFLIHVNDVKQTVSSDLLLYADDSCLVFQHKHVTEIETHLNNDFSNLCEWFLDNKLSIHFGEDKTKSILFGTKRKLRKVGQLNITYQGVDMKYLPWLKLLILVAYLMRQCLVNQWLGKL